MDYELLYLKKPKQTLGGDPDTSWQHAEINNDGSLLPDSREGSWGFVVRENTGDIVGSGARKLRCVHDATHAEAEAFLQAIQAARYCSVMRIIKIEAHELMKAITYQDLAPSGVLFREIKVCPALHFCASISIVL